MTDPALIAQADQVMASVRDLDAGLLPAIEDIVGGPGRWTPASPTAGWLGEVLARHNAAASRGGTCRHAATAPETHIAAWRPGLLVCTDCAAALDAGDLERWTCDRCGGHHPDHIDQAAARITLTGRLTHVWLWYGTCPPCGDLTCDELGVPHPRAEHPRTDA